MWICVCQILHLLQAGKFTNNLQQLHNKVEHWIQHDLNQYFFFSCYNLKVYFLYIFDQPPKKSTKCNTGIWYSFCKPYPSCCNVTESSQVKGVFSLPFWTVIFSEVTVTFKFRYLFAMPSFPKYVFCDFASLFALLSPMSSPLTVMPNVIRKQQILFYRWDVKECCSSYSSTKQIQIEK